MRWLLRARTRDAHRPSVVALVVFSTVPLLLLAAANAWRGTTETETRVVEQRIALARAAAASTAAYVEGHLNTIRSLALAPAVTDPRRPSLDRFLEQLVAQHPEWEGIGVLDPTEAGAPSPLAAARTLNLPGRSSLAPALRAGRPYVSAAVMNSQTSRPTIVLATPVDFVDGRRGLLAVALSVEKLGEELRDLHGGDVRISVVDQEGQLFVHPGRAGTDQLTSALELPEARDVLAGNSGSRRATGPDGVEQLMAYAPVRGLGWGVFAAQPAETAFGPVRGYLATSVALLTLTAACTAGIGWYVGGRIAYAHQRELVARGETERALRESSRMKDEFLAVISHELRTPLTAITGYTDILLRKTHGPLTERQERQLTNVREAARRQLALINDLLDASKLEAGAMDLHLEAVPPVAALHQAAAATQVLAGARAVTLVVEEPATPLPPVAADPERLQQILLNLISNAIKFTPGGGRVVLSAHAAPDPGDAFVELRVHDTGIGILPAHLPHIWERFYQAESSSARRYSGTGLGLTIVKRLAELHGGRVAAASEGLDQGSTFSVWLPAAPAPAPTPEARAAPAPPAPSTLPPMPPPGEANVPGAPGAPGAATAVPASRSNPAPPLAHS